MKKIGNELKKEGDKYNISANIIKMASKLEEQIGNQNNEEKEQDVKNDDSMIEFKKINSFVDIMDQKPLSFKKKKTSKKQKIRNSLFLIIIYILNYI